MPTLPDASLSQFFTDARSHNGWLDRPVTDEQIRALYDLLKMAPTSLNCLPGRFVFLRTAAAKARILPHMMDGNRAKTESAPVVVIVGHDLRFFEHLPRLFPFMECASWFSGNAAFARETALRNGSLQGAYLMLAARSLGLDVGPMSGFNNAGVNAEFFPDGRVESNFVCSLGYGDNAKLYPRGDRLTFDEACTLL